ncbi:hypothetical protein VTN00DRAFT_737 [Thermoascus crustaceus]|uniref:uncharacterized protein n=1 Tax=Thermoascus crustaceus TaxID=5088 RepID=UPI003742D32B
MHHSHFLSELADLTSSPGLDGSCSSTLTGEIADQSSGGEMLNFSIPRPRNKWTEHQRDALCCIRRFFSLSKDDEKSIFNRIFEQDLLKCGFSNGIPSSSLNTQWVDIRAKSDYVWGEVYLRTEFTEKEGRWAPIVAEIRNAAQELDITLQEKTFDDIDVSSFGCRRPAKPRARRVKELISEEQEQKQAMNEVGTETSSAFAALDEINSITTTPSSVKEHYLPPFNVDNTKKDGLPTAGGKVCFWCSDEGVDLHSPERNHDIESLLESSTGQTTPSPIKKPKLLYRWHNADSNGINTRSWFVAGLFQDNPKTIPLPTDYSDDEFDIMLERHLRIERVSSPFISTTGTPLAPIHRALRKREGAVLTLIDSSKVQAEIYSAQFLMWQKKIKISRYQGYDEFLVWGEIPRGAIICSTKITDLERIAANNTDIGVLLKLDVIESFEKIRISMKNKLSLGNGRFDRATGFTVGKLLRHVGVPERYTDDVAKRIAASWRFKKKQGARTAYLEGVRIGYMSSSSTEPSSSVPSVSHAAVRNMPESIMSDLDGDQNSDVHDRDAAGTYTDDDSDYDEEEGEGDGEENEEEQDGNERSDDSDDSTNIDDTPCPPPRTIIAETHTSMPELRLPSPALEHPLPEEPSGGILDLLNTASGTWSPSYQVDDESRPTKRTKREHPTAESTAVRVEVFNPASRSWSPLANQRGITVPSTQPRHDNNDNNVIVIDDESENESECDENQDYDRDKDDDMSMAEAPVLGTNVPSHRDHHLEQPRDAESGDQFTRERAHVDHILKLHGILR